MFGRRLALIVALAAAGAATAGCGKSAPATHAVVPGARAGVVREVTGTVTATRPGAAARPLAAGDAVSGDDVIATGADGSVLIELDHNHVTFTLPANKQQQVAASLAWNQPVAVAQAAPGADEHSAAAGRAIERSAVDTSASSTETAPVAPGAAAQAPTAPPPAAQAPKPPEPEPEQPRTKGTPTAAAGADDGEERGGGGHAETAPAPKAMINPNMKTPDSQAITADDGLTAPTMANDEPAPPPPPPPPPDTGGGSPGPNAGAPRVPPIATISTAGALSTADLGGQLEIDKIRVCLGGATKAMLVVGTDGKIARVTTNGTSSATTCVRAAVKPVKLPVKHSQTTIKIVFPAP